MKDVKEKALNLKAKHHKTKEQSKTIKKRCKQERLHKRSTRVMTNTKNSEEKTSKKIRYSMKRKAHKRNLEKSTRIDEENKKIELLEKYFCANCA